MGKEALWLGIVGIALGIGIIIKTLNFWAALTPIIIGIALILFRNSEDNIEERKDKRR